MLLTGTYERTIDDKFRLAVPKRMRDAVGNDCVMFLTRGTDGTLALYPEESFMNLSSQLAASSPNAQNVRTFSRVFFAQAERLDMDKLGRVRIPPELAKLVSIKKEVVLLGVRDHIEIWDRELWKQYLSDAQSDFDTIAEEAFEPKLPLPDSRLQDSADRQRILPR
jgi:MraZ protein